MAMRWRQPAPAAGWAKSAAQAGRRPPSSRLRVQELSRHAALHCGQQTQAAARTGANQGILHAAAAGGGGQPAEIGRGGAALGCTSQRGDHCLSTMQHGWQSLLASGSNLPSSPLASGNKLHALAHRAENRAETSPLLPLPWLTGCRPPSCSQPPAASPAGGRPGGTSAAAGRGSNVDMRCTAAPPG